MAITINPGSKAAHAYQSTRSMEQFYCNFGLNPQHREKLEKAGLAVTGTDENGEARIIELASHPLTET